MSPQQFIETKLQSLQSNPAFVLKGDELVAELQRLLLSKKFRKYSANADLIEHCHQAIVEKVVNNQPINVTFLHGAYKLWRLDESPVCDWAELFALMYYTNWMKRLCAVYEPGVHFDFFVDDWIVPKMNNVLQSDVDAYLESYQSLLDFLKPFQPENLQMTITPVGSQFESEDQFNTLLKTELAITPLPDINEQTKAMVELNVRTTAEQAADPDWQRKVWQLHIAYSPVKKSVNYHYRPDKILAFTQPLPSGTTISVGTTKSSVMKFWVGVGALQSNSNSFKEVILSGNQLKDIEYQWVDTSVGGLVGDNFKKIRVLR